jgi:hypothetical protein
MALVDAHEQEATSYRAAVDAMIDSGELVIPGQLETWKPTSFPNTGK